MEKISDYELMKGVANGCHWSQAQLWTRYQPVISKRSRHLHTIVGSRYEMDDYKQEFYIAFLKAIDYFDLKKAPDESFSFGTILFYFLRKAEYLFRKEFFNLNKNEYSLISYEDILKRDKDEDKSRFKLANVKINKNFVVNFHDDLILINSELQKIKKKLNKHQSNILDDLINKENVVNISEKRNRKYSQVYRDVVHIRSEVKKHFKGVIHV